MTTVTQESKTTEHLQVNERYGAHNYHPLPVIITSGEGCWITDIEGNKFRVIPNSGGEPFLAPECAPGLPCLAYE